MAWRKPDAALVAEFDAAAQRLPGVERRQMFGCPSAFVNGQLFAGVWQDRLLVRVPEVAAQHPFAPGGRPMKEYAALPGALDWPGGEMEQWLLRAHGYAASLPPKVSRPAAARKAAVPRKRG